MGLYIQAILMTTAILKLLNADEMPDDTEACSNHSVISDRTRLFHYSQTLDNCDSNLAVGWYKFEADGSAVQIPRTCLKNRCCGTRLPLRLDLGDQSLPTPNATLWAHVCTSYAILDKWDCCVLRQRAGIRNCGDFFVYYLNPTDRCDVGYCVQEPGNNPSEEYTAKTGDHVQVINTERPAPILTTETAENQTSNVITIGTPLQSQATSSPEYSVTSRMSPVNASQIGRTQCSFNHSFSCNGNRTCYSSREGPREQRRLVVHIECSNGRGCGILCDNVPDCTDHSDETVADCQPVVCTEGRQQCPESKACFTRCDGRQECSDGSDEDGCGFLDESSDDVLSTLSSSILRTSTARQLLEPSFVSVSSASVQTNVTVPQRPSEVSPLGYTTPCTDSFPMTSLLPSPSSVIRSDTVSLKESKHSVISHILSPSASLQVRNDTEIAGRSTLIDSSTTSDVEATYISLSSKVPSTRMYMQDTSIASAVSSQIFTDIASSSSVIQSLHSTLNLDFESTELRGIESKVPTTLAVQTSTSSALPVTLTTSTASVHIGDLSSTSEQILPETQIPKTAGDFDSFDSQGITHTSASSATISTSSLQIQTSEVPSIIETMSSINTTIITRVSATAQSGLKSSSLEPSSFIHRTPISSYLSATLRTSVSESQALLSSPPAYLSTEPILWTKSITEAPENASRERLASSVYSSTLSSIETTTSSILTGPDVLTFEVIGTRYRDVKEKVEEPTFEEMLRKAIAAVLNEYSDRSRRSVQNFTDQHVHITDMTWGTDNATVSLAVNSTKAGEIYVPVTELQTVFSNQSAIDLLCHELLTQTPAGISSTTITILEPEKSSTMISPSRTMHRLSDMETPSHLTSDMLLSTEKFDSITPVKDIMLQSTSSESARFAYGTESFLLTVVESNTKQYNRFISTSSIPLESRTFPLYSQTEEILLASVSQTEIFSSDTEMKTPDRTSSITSTCTTGELRLTATTKVVPSTSTAGLQYSPTIGYMASEVDSLLSTVAYSASDTIAETLLEPSSESIPFVFSSHSEYGFEPESSYMPIAPTPTMSTFIKTTLVTLPSSAIDSAKEAALSTVTRHDTRKSDSVTVSSSRVIQPSKMDRSVKTREPSSFAMSSTIMSSESYITSIVPPATESLNVSSTGNITLTLETVTHIQISEGNMTQEKPLEMDRKTVFEQNIGLFIFLIVAGSCLVGTCIFAIIGTIYRRRLHTWNPRMAYQDAYGDMEKNKLSFHRDVLGVESPIPDIDILKGETSQQETSLSKASTMTLPRTPRNGASQCDETLTAGPSDASFVLNHSETNMPSRDDMASPDRDECSGLVNRGFEGDRDSGVDGIVPVDELDNIDPRKSFPWIEQLEDTRL